MPSMACQYSSSRITETIYTVLSQGAAPTVARFRNTTVTLIEYPEERKVTTTPSVAASERG